MILEKTQIYCLVVLLAALACAQTTRADPERSYQCEVSQVPTAWAFDDGPGKIENNNAWFSAAGWSTLDLRFRNKETLPIYALALVVAYLDSNRQVIEEVPMFARVNPSIAKAPADQLQPADAWASALMPGGTALMTATMYGVRTGRCPASARITFARIHFEDGRVRTFSAPSWHLPAMPSSVPRVDETAPEPPVGMPASLLASLKIGASGNVLGVTPLESADPNFVDWIRAQMKEQDWRFYPALLNGNAVDSEISALFLLLPKGTRNFPDKVPVLQPVTVIRFTWDHKAHLTSDDTERPTVMYGFLRSGSTPNFPQREFTSKPADADAAHNAR